jgi:hypothetical protein
MNTTAAATGWVHRTEKVADLMGCLDPQYRVEGINDDGEVEPDWNKVEQFAALMRAGTFDFDAEDITLIGIPDGDRMVFDGNHRVLAADLAGVDSLPVGYTLRPFG